MTSTVQTQSDLARAVEYVRQARRLRARYAHDLPLLHQCLSQLTPAPVRKPVVRRVDNVRDQPADPPPLTRAALARTAFASAVSDALDGPVLRYSVRLNLLKQASRLGLGRFEANLVIAEVQHTQPFQERAQENPAGKTSALQTITTFVVVQVLVVVSAYALAVGF